ncbi:MAG: hypothetical protein HBSAPP03_00810 [Phycisphaerae bacterium]|nr:MAG: hypothetical protein HBSAPP03_00810 [Phycisphaerae bacterium]
MTPKATTRSCGPAHSGVVSLPVVPGGRTTPNLPRKSRMGKKRAAVLIGVHVLMAAHIIQWLMHGKTISPVEPSESMATLEKGELNAGFVLFCAAMISTVVFGRYFCGWACHVVALQDLCAHWMNKLGVRPRPFRSRLPLYWALLLALYMFVWPTFKREVVFPLMRWAEMPRPEWLADVASFPKEGLQPHFVVENFWATFAGPAVAVPFLLVCGFATVYFLGSKAFCTYGCPYGAFFAPLDRLSVGRIVVSDACNHCGHCTTACTSNVRVHQEVRDFGMVMDPGCMKCMDCVSVCPNDALSFSFAKPSALTKARTEEARAGKIDRPAPDLTWWEEAWVFVAGIAYFVALRQFLDLVPLLMAAGLAMIGAFGAWKLSRLFRDPSVRLQSLQLKITGRWTTAGRLVAAGVVLFSAMAGWSGWVRWQRHSADLIDAQIRVPAEVVYAPGYRPRAEDKALAERARAKYERALSWKEGGWGWQPPPAIYVRLSWLSAVAGDLPAGERYLRRMMEMVEPAEELVRSLEQVRALQDDTLDQAIETYRAVLTQYPDINGSRLRLAVLLGAKGDLVACEAEVETVLGNVRRPPTPIQVVGGSELLMGLGKIERSLGILRGAIERHPDVAILRAGYGRALYFSGQPGAAIDELERAATLEPKNRQFLLVLAQMYDEQGRPVDLARIERRLAELESPSPGIP